MNTTIEELSVSVVEARYRAVHLGLHTPEGNKAADEYAALFQQLAEARRADRYAKRVAKQASK